MTFKTEESICDCTGAVVWKQLVPSVTAELQASNDLVIRLREKDTGACAGLNWRLKGIFTCAPEGGGGGRVLIKVALGLPRAALIRTVPASCVFSILPFKMAVGAPQLKLIQQTLAKALHRYFEMQRC